MLKLKPVLIRKFLTQYEVRKGETLTVYINTSADQYEDYLWILH